MKEYRLVEKVNLQDIQACLTTHSNEGWSLHTIIDDGKTPWIRIIFERDRSDVELPIQEELLSKVKKKVKKRGRPKKVVGDILEEV